MNDSDAIRQAVLDYVEGWYEGDPERIRRSLHPALVKRALKRESADGLEYLNYLTQEEMVAATESGGGTRVPPHERRYDISILDRYEEIATVKAINPHWIDYLHLVKISGQWLIANVLYTENRKNT